MVLNRESTIDMHRFDGCMHFSYKKSFSIKTGYNQSREPLNSQVSSLSAWSPPSHCYCKKGFFVTNWHVTQHAKPHLPRKCYGWLSYHMCWWTVILEDRNELIKLTILYHRLTRQRWQLVPQALVQILYLHA